MTVDTAQHKPGYFAVVRANCPFDPGGTADIAGAHALLFRVPWQPLGSSCPAHRTARCPGPSRPGNGNLPRRIQPRRTVDRAHGYRTALRTPLLRQPRRGGQRGVLWSGVLRVGGSRGLQRMGAARMRFRVTGGPAVPGSAVRLGRRRLPHRAFRAVLGQPGQTRIARDNDARVTLRTVAPKTPAPGTS